MSVLLILTSTVVTREGSSLRRMFSTKVEKCVDVTAAGYDAVVVVAPSVAAAPEAVR